MENNMLKAMALVFAVAGCLRCATIHADDKTEAAVKMELSRLQGVWKLSEARHAGEVVEEGEPQEFEIKGTKLISRKGDRTPITMTLRLDLSGDPKLIDWTTDPKGEFKDADKYAEGVYKLDGDTLTVCYHVRDNRFAKGNRPTEFKSAEGSDAMLIVLKRSKK